MNDSSQRQVFLQGEGDAWFTRNFQSDSNQSASWIDQDLLLKLIENLPCRCPRFLFLRWVVAKVFV